MIRLVILVAALSAPAHAQDAWACRFTVTCDAGLCGPSDDRLDITSLDHEPGLFFDYFGTIASVGAIHSPDSLRRSYATHGHEDVHVVTVFPDGQALGSIHRSDAATGTATGTISYGTCQPL